MVFNFIHLSHFQKHELKVCCIIIFSVFNPYQTKSTPKVYFPTISDPSVDKSLSRFLTVLFSVRLTSDVSWVARGSGGSLLCQGSELSLCPAGQLAARDICCALYLALSVAEIISCIARHENGVFSFFKGSLVQSTVCSPFTDSSY